MHKAEKVFYQHVWQVADHFGKSIESIKYHIGRGRLPDPRIEPVDPDTLVWPAAIPRGSKLFPKLPRKTTDRHQLNERFITIGDIVNMINDLKARIETLEGRLKETHASTHVDTRS